MPKINFFQILCSLFVGLLRPFSVVLEMFCHEEVGERYPGFASVAALLTLLGWCFFSDDVFPLHVLMLAFVVRLIVHRVMAIRHRSAWRRLCRQSLARPSVGGACDTPTPRTGACLAGTAGSFGGSPW